MIFGKKWTLPAIVNISLYQKIARKNLIKINKNHRFLTALSYIHLFKSLSTPDISSDKNYFWK